MAERTEQYRKILAELSTTMSKIIDTGEFGTITLITSPSGRDFSAGDLKGWASPDLREQHTTPEILLVPLLSLVKVLLGRENVGPEALHQLVMSVAVDMGVAAVITVDEEGNAVLNGTILDDDIPQA
jgi:hypothetical protein